jgi:hypothetical protein
MKELFQDITYEVKKRSELVNINNTYNELMNKTINTSDVRELEMSKTKLFNKKKDILTLLNDYIDLISEQISIYNIKSKELKKIDKYLMELDDKNKSLITYDTNLKELQDLENKYYKHNIYILIIVIILSLIFILIVTYSFINT